MVGGSARARAKAHFAEGVAHGLQELEQPLAEAQAALAESMARVQAYETTDADLRRQLREAQQLMTNECSKCTVRGSRPGGHE